MGRARALVAQLPLEAVNPLGPARALQVLVACHVVQQRARALVAQLPLEAVNPLAELLAQLPLAEEHPWMLKIYVQRDALAEAQHPPAHLAEKRKAYQIPHHLWEEALENYP